MSVTQLPLTVSEIWNVLADRVRQGDAIAVHRGERWSLAVWFDEDTDEWVTEMRQPANGTGVAP